VPLLSRFGAGLALTDQEAFLQAFDCCCKHAATQLWPAGINFSFLVAKL
jgi:hypothetical protein